MKASMTAALALVVERRAIRRPMGLSANGLRDGLPLE